MYEYHGSNAQSEIKSLQERLYDDACRTRGASVQERLVSEQESLVQWAEQHGRLIAEDACRLWLGGIQEIACGQEHAVYLDRSVSRVIKVTIHGSYGLSGYAYRYLEYLYLSNELFGDDIRLGGILPSYDELNEEPYAAIVTSQPFIAGERPTEEEITAWFAQYGYALESRHTYVNHAERVRVSDAHTGNLIRVEDQQLVPIDVLPERF